MNLLLMGVGGGFTLGAGFVMAFLDYQGEGACGPRGISLPAFLNLAMGIALTTVSITAAAS